MGTTRSSYDPLKYLKRRSRSAYITALLSISLVLFFLGLFSGLILYGSNFARQARESIQMKVFLFDGIGDEQRLKFESWLRDQTYVQSLSFVSKEEAGRLLTERTGENPAELMGGFNPLPASYNVQLHQAYIQNDSLPSIRESISQNLIVSDVSYPVEMLTNLSRNLRILAAILLLLGLILLGIALYLIFATIRLAIYAQRLTIRSMQLIGATRAFIRRPFLLRGLIQGGLAGLLAGGFLLLTRFMIQAGLAGWGLPNALEMGPAWIGLLVGIVLFGLLLGGSGSFLAVNQYLNRNLDELM